MRYHQCVFVKDSELVFFSFDVECGLFCIHYVVR